jgi:hypothetical protein
MRIRSLGTLATIVVACLFTIEVASAAIGWYAKWGGSAPITVKVIGIANLPVEQRPIFRAAMNDWSLSTSVDMVEATSGKVRVFVDTQCQYACTKPNFNNGKLNGAEIHINPVVLTFTDTQFYFCHELGHALGLGEGYPVEQTGDYGSCMSGSPPGSLHPSAMDYAALTSMYPLGSGRH